MAIIYFTNNASSGAGSLVNAINNASPGDVVRPDESVFERGSTIEIVLAATLTVDKNLTLDGSPFRVRLNGGGAIRCASVAANVTATFIGVDFAAGYNNGVGGGINAPGTTDVTFERCGFYGCKSNLGGGAYTTGTTRYNDCAFLGCVATESGGAVYASKETTLNGVTAAGCVAANKGDSLHIVNGTATAVNAILCGSVGNPQFLTAIGSVVGVASSQIGFVAPPPDDLSAETWDADAWQNWDLRLLDDALPNPSPYRDSGDVDAASKYDFDGNFRGRETNGVATCSPGAFETIQADLFWVGRDATGAEVVSPSWLSAEGWAASRFATVSGDVAPQSGKSVFADGSIAFDGNSLRLKKLVIGGGASLSVDNSSDATLTAISDQFDFGVGSTLRNIGASTQRFQVGRASLVSRFGDWVNIQPQFLLGDAVGLEIAPTAKFTTVASGVKLYANGFYTNYNLQITNVATVEGDSNGCENVYISFQKPTARIAANGAPRVACGLVKWTTPSGATSDFTALETGSAPIIFAPRRSATVAGNGSRDDFLIDVSNAQTSGTLALTLTDQTVFGDALSSAVALTGIATIGEHGLTSRSLTLNADATLNVDGGFTCVETLTVADGASVAFSGVDAVLTATKNATVGVATFSGTGYFATPPGTDLTAATLAESIRVCDCGANVETFSASASSVITADLAWKQSNENCAVLLEVYDNGWKVIGDNVDASASPFETTLNGSQRFRIFDGSEFLYDDAYFAVKSFYIYSISSTQKDVESLALYSKKTQIIRANMEGTRNENILLLAQIKNLLTGEFLSTTTVDNIKASVYKVNKSISSGDVWEAQDEWTEVVVEKETILEEPVMIDGWTNDDTGANFIWTPDTRNKSLFKDGGRYVIQVTFNLINDNPIVISFNINVK